MINIIRMELKHVDEIYEIEKGCFSTPWSRDAFVGEMSNNLAYYFVAVDSDDNKIVGYAGVWHVVNEGHITNIAVDEGYRGKGIGSALLEKIINLAWEKDMIGITLEVRVGNKIAMGLYSKHGFKVEGIRKNYYSDIKEDAIVMWKYL